MPEPQTLLDILLLNLAVTAAAFTAIWIVSLPLRNAGIVDVYWGPGFAVIAWTTWMYTDGDPVRSALLTGMATIWGLRLGFHLGHRTVNHGEEDRRYADMRNHRPTRFWWWSLPVVFLLQALIMWAVSLPLQAGQIPQAPTGPTVLDAVGVVLFVVGLTIEVMADRQLTRFRADPDSKGKVLQSGLWAWSRHPNYFGDALVWWGIYCVAASATGMWWTVIGPLLMTFFLVRISGVTLLEQTIGERRPGYADYRRRTSAFIPWPPKRSDD